MDAGCPHHNFIPCYKDSHLLVVQVLILALQAKARVNVLAQKVLILATSLYILLNHLKIPRAMTLAKTSRIWVKPLKEFAVIGMKIGKVARVLVNQHKPIQHQIAQNHNKRGI